jgi:iron complex transport system substrate-binding protein
MTSRSPLHQAPSRTVGTGSSHVRRRLAALTTALVLAWTAFATQAGAAASPGPVAGPIQVVDDEGTVVDIPAVPVRVISLSPANTEIVYALGAGDRLVGGTDFDDYPPEAAALPDAATFNGVLLEKVVALDPDLVLAAGNGFNPPADIRRMRELGLPVLVVYAESMEGVIADVRLIAEALGAADAGEAVAQRMDADIDRVVEAVASIAERPRTFYQIGWVEPQLFAPPPDSVYADMIALAGGEPVTTGVDDVFSMSLEALVAADPEVILLGDAIYPGGACPDDVATRPGWDTITAVIHGDVRPVDDLLVTRPGPRITDGLASVARGIHPDIDLPGFAPDPPMCGTGSTPAPAAASSSGQP